MHDYITVTKYAVESTIAAYTHEYRELNFRVQQFQEAGESSLTFNQIIDQNGLLDTALDVEHFPKQLHRLSQMIDQASIAGPEMLRISSKLAARMSATAVLCGAVIQIAKQGISVVHGGLELCPPGRPIGSQDLKMVIWQGRNQTIHYEEAHMNQRATECFNALDRDFGLNLSSRLAQGTNLAIEVIDVLKWHSYSAYEDDMVSLLG